MQYVRTCKPGLAFLLYMVFSELLLPPFILVKRVYTVSAWAVTVETLFTKMNEGSSSSGKTIYKRKAIPGLHVRVYCKHEVYLKDRNYLGLEVNKTKRYPGWKSVFTK